MSPDDIIRRIEAESRKRLARAAAHLTGELKRVLSVPAPRKVSKATGKPYATTRAIPGAPPRKVTGRGRASVSWKLVDGPAAIVGTPVDYMGFHERKNHPWLRITFDRERGRINAILRGGVA